MGKRNKRHRDWGQPYGERETTPHQMLIVALVAAVAIGVVWWLISML